MRLSLRKNGLTSLFKEVRVFRVLYSVARRAVPNLRAVPRNMINYSLGWPCTKESSRMSRNHPKVSYDSKLAWAPIRYV